MKTLFLSSIACNVLNSIVTYLPKSPERLKVAFIPTAANPSTNKEGINNDRNMLVEIGFKVVDIDVSFVRNNDLRKALDGVDIIFVAGGNTFYLLQESNKSGFSELLIELIHAGIIYIGSSAGAVLVGPTIGPISMMDDPRLAPELTSYDGLGLVEFIPLVHFGNDEYREHYLKALGELYTSSPKFVLVRDDQFIIIQDDYWKLL